MDDHHSAEEELIAHRIRKMERLRERADEPFKYRIDFDAIEAAREEGEAEDAYRFERRARICEVRARFEQSESEIAAGAAAPLRVAVAGRMVSYRDHGKTVFANVRDETGQVQVYLSKKHLTEAAFEGLNDLDIGDFVAVVGKVFRTRTQEITVEVRGYVILSKSLRPLPEKYHGLTDVETRYRQRYLDMVANPEVLDTFRKRVQVVNTMRDWLNRRGFLEVETPMLQPIPGGATARPFITHHNTFDRDLYLRVAPELYLKRLIVGGFEKVYEINRCFRNEGVDTRHNPEFTTMELYQAYQDYMGLMDETEELLCAIIESVTGGLEFEYQGERINAARPWKRLTLFEAIREYAGIDLEVTQDREQAAALARSLDVDVDPTMGYGKIVDAVMSEKVQPHLVQPTFLYDYPLEISPLAKKKRGNPLLTERFQPFMGRLEVGNAFSELNDPIDQRARFMDQVRQRERGDDEAQYLDEDFITALEVGMPPTAGLGIGIDRLAMLLTDSASIREVIFFPQLRTL